MTEEENKQRMHDLLVEIETLEKDNFPIKQQCTEAIACLERAHEMFVQRATNEGYSLQDYRLGEIEIKQLINVAFFNGFILFIYYSGW